MGEQEAASGMEDCTEPAGGCFVFSNGIGTVVGKWMKVKEWNKCRIGGF